MRRSGGGRLRGRSSCAVCLWACLACFACGAPEAAKIAPPVRAPESKPRPEPEQDVVRGLPDDTILIGRWRDPSALLDKLRPLADSDGSLELALRARIGQPRHAVDLGKPIELLAVLDRRSTPPGLAWAVSFGLVAEDASAAPPSGPLDVPSPIGLHCAEASSVGAAPLRMVCATADEHLAELLAGATRALPLEPLSDAELAFALRTQPLRGIDDRALHSLVSAWLARALGVPSMNERFDAQFAALASALSRELRDVAEDLDGAVIESALAPHGRGLELSFEAPAGPHRSALAEMVLGTRASGLAPADFWYAHAASVEAGFLWTFAAAPIERWRGPLSELLGTALDFRGVPSRLGRQARYLIESLPVPRGPVVHASGVVPAGHDAKGAREPVPARQAWHLLVVRGSFAEYQYYVSELVKAFSDPILGPQFGRLLRAAFGPEAAPRRLRQRRPLVSQRLPKHSFTLEITLPEAPASARADEREGDARGAEATWYVLMAPDEDGIKIAWGADEKFLASLLIDPARMKATSTLASRPGLALLHERRTLAGGFYSLAALGEPDSQIGMSLGLAPGALSRLENAPHRGASPIVYALSAGDDAPLAFTANLGRETLEDLLFWISGDAAVKHAGADQ